MIYLFDLEVGARKETLAGWANYQYALKQLPSDGMGAILPPGLIQDGAGEESLDPVDDGRLSDDLEDGAHPANGLKPVEALDPRFAAVARGPEDYPNRPEEP
jgi:hypothetical protein